MKISKKYGFLVFFIDCLTNLWLVYLDICSWAEVFHSIKKNSYNKLVLQQNNFLHDVAWLFMLFISITSYYIINNQSIFIQSFITSIAIWRVIDRFIDSLRLPIFGWMNKPGEIEELSLRRSQRRILLILIYFLELIFWYSIIYYFFSKYDIIRVCTPFKDISNALYMSFSTATTIGYGKYSPINNIAIYLSMLQFFTSFLYLSITIATLASLTKINNQILRKKYHEAQQNLSTSKIKLRIVIPALFTLIFIFAINLIIVSSIKEKAGINYSEIIKIYLSIFILLLLGIGTILMVNKSLLFINTTSSKT